RRVATCGLRICPASPRVADTTITCAPLTIYLAKVPPAQKDSSSGWANTPRMRGSRSVEKVFIDDPPFWSSSSLLALCLFNEEIQAMRAALLSWMVGRPLAWVFHREG